MMDGNYWSPVRMAGMKRSQAEIDFEAIDDPADVQDYKRLRAVNPINGRMYSDNYYTLQTKRKSLPIAAQEAAIVKHISQWPITLLTGETGSGKTTQVPQFILCNLRPLKRVYCTQPRRVAAISVAMRVADEMDVHIGDEVGYSVRFEQKNSEKTRILYLTEGMLLKELIEDPLLTQCSYLVVDEAHERTAETDVVCGLVKRLVNQRSDIHVLIMSATLDMEKFTKFFNAPLIEVPGRQFNVDVWYAEHPVKDYRQSAVDYAVNIHAKEPPGDILVFLTGESEIESAVAACEERISDMRRTDGSVMSALVFALYANLPIQEQKKVFMTPPPDTRKIIFATNIAETSVTIDGIVYVVDSGFVKVKLFHPQLGVDSLIRHETSKASAEQRKGRAGRTREGKCFRLYIREAFNKFKDQNYPEIMRTELTDFVLRLMKLGVENVVQFSYIDAPSPASVMEAMVQLSYFGAIDDDCRLTPLGSQMGDLPLDVASARTFLMSGNHGCSVEICMIAAMLNAGRVFSRPFRKAREADAQKEQFRCPESDHITLLRAFQAFLLNHQSAKFCYENFLQYRSLSQAFRIYTQLIGLLKRFAVPERNTWTPDNGFDSVRVRRALIEGFFTHVSYNKVGTNSYVTVRKHVPAQFATGCVIPPNRPRWVMYHQLENKADGTVINTVSAIDPRWLHEVSPSYFNPLEIEDPEISLALTQLQQHSDYTKL